eukprot:1154615-Pelagomonas_calceolata.AAC.1
MAKQINVFSSNAIENTNPSHSQTAAGLTAPLNQCPWQVDDPSSYQHVFDQVEQLAYCKYRARVHWGKNSNRAFLNPICPTKYKYPEFNTIVEVRQKPCQKAEEYLVCKSKNLSLQHTWSATIKDSVLGSVKDAIGISNERGQSALLLDTVSKKLKLLSCLMCGLCAVMPQPYFSLNRVHAAVA